MNTRGFGLGLVFGATAAGAAATLVVLKRAPTQPSAQQQHKALKYGLPGSTNLRFYKNFVISYDPRLRNPQWVLEHITADAGPGNGNRKNVEFKEDDSMEERFRSRLSDFRGSGYDRGHMAPAANHKGSQEDMDSTFTLSNCSPQVGKGFNRDYWARFERFVKELTYTCSEVFIVTGPLYVPQRSDQGFVLHHPLIGEPPRLVAVPTHFFKVLLAERAASSDDDGKAQVVLGAFVMPNAPIEPDTPLTAFSVPLEALECVSGLEFFPDFISDERRLLHDQAALSWQGLGRRQLQSRQRSSQPLALLDFVPSQPALPQTPEAAIVVEELPVGVLDKPMAEKTPVQALKVKQKERRKQINKPLEEADAGPGASNEDAGANAYTSHSSYSHPSPARGEEAHISSNPEGVNSQENPRQMNQGVRAAEENRVRPLQSNAPDSVAGELRSSLDGVPVMVEAKPVHEDDAAAPWGREGLGFLHVCSHVACKLPALDWYLKRREPRA